MEATWAYNTTWKNTIGFTPFDLFYGKKESFSIKFEYNILRMEIQLDLDITRAQEERLQQINAIDEHRLHALMHTEVVKLQRKVSDNKPIENF